ncbi:MAG: GNAT family N-acetyltransferase [Pseudoxanthomonas sp.]
MPAGPHPGLELRFPRLDEEAQFLRAHHTTTPDYPNFLHYHAEGMDFATYLQTLREQQQGVNPPTPRHVASSFLFAFDGARIVGRVSIRHQLNEFLLRNGGHIGYVVVPEFRGRGYASAMLAKALVIARDELGIARALLTCAEDNAASIKVIERNGGMFEGFSEEFLPRVRRYWIGTSR